MLPFTSDCECPQFVVLCQSSTLVYFRVYTHVYFLSSSQDTNCPCNELNICTFINSTCWVPTLHRVGTWGGVSWGWGWSSDKSDGKVSGLSTHCVRRQLENSRLQIQKTAHTWPQPWWHTGLELPRPENMKTNFCGRGRSAIMILSTHLTTAAFCKLTPSFHHVVWLFSLVTRLLLFWWMNCGLLSCSTGDLSSLPGSKHSLYVCPHPLSHSLCTFRICAKAASD